MNICTVSNLRTLIILSRYAKRNGKLSMAALRCSLGGTQTQDFMFPWLRMASVSVLHFMTYLGTKTDLIQYTYSNILIINQSLHFNKYETAPSFIQLTQNLTSDCLLINKQSYVKFGPFGWSINPIPTREQILPTLYYFLSLLASLFTN